MRNVIVAMLFITSAVFAADEGDAFITAGLSLTVKNPEVARDMLLRGIARSANAPAKAYMELAKLSESEKDVSVSLYTTAYRLMVQDPKSAADCKFILGRLQILSKPTADLIVAMGSYSTELQTISKVRKDELTQDTIQERTEQLQLSHYVAAAAGGSKVDLLKLVDASRDTVRGHWTMSGSKLSCDAGYKATLQFPYQPPKEYDYRIVFVRKSGSDTVCQVGVTGKSFLWAMGGWNNSVFGFDDCDGKSADNNPTTVHSSDEVGIKNGKVHESIIKVRATKIEVFLDRKLVCSWDKGNDRLSTHADWNLRDRALLGVGAMSSALEIQAAEVTEISGPGVRK